MRRSLGFLVSIVTIGVFACIAVVAGSSVRGASNTPPEPLFAAATSGSRVTDATATLVLPVSSPAAASQPTDGDDSVVSADILGIAVSVREPAPEPTAQQRLAIAANDQKALERLQRFAIGGKLFEFGEEFTTDGSELVFGGYRFTLVVYDEVNKARIQAIPTKLVRPVADTVSYYVFAWPDKYTTGHVALVMDKFGDIAANAGTTASGPSGMTAGCKCGDRFANANGSVRNGLGADMAHGGKWTLSSPVGN